MIAGHEKEFILYEDAKTKVVKIESYQARTEFMEEAFDELVTIVQAWAQLEINQQMIELKVGDYYFIPKKTCHRVWMTSSDCIWITIYYKS